MLHSIKDIPKVKLLAKLYNNANSPFSCLINVKESWMTEEEAAFHIDKNFKNKLHNEQFYKEIASGEFTPDMQCSLLPSACYFDYLEGRSLKTMIAYDNMDSSAYLKDNKVDIEKMLEKLRQPETSGEIDGMPHYSMLSGEHEYKFYFIHKIKEVASTINPYTEELDLNAQLMLYDLSEKCKNSHFDDSYSKEDLRNAGLYPFEWVDKLGVTILCDLLKPSEEEAHSHYDEL